MGRHAGAIVVHDLVRGCLRSVTDDVDQHVAVDVLGVFTLDPRPAQERDDLMDAVQLTAR